MACATDTEPICEDFGCTPTLIDGDLACTHCKLPMVACVKCSMHRDFPESPVYHVKPECKP